MSELCKTNTKHVRFGSLNFKLLVVMFINFFIAAAMYYFSILASSSALFAEFVHNACDGICILTAFVASLVTSTKIFDERSTYSFSRVEIISALLNSSVVIVVASFALLNSIRSIESSVSGLIMAKAAALAFVANGLCIIILRNPANLNEEAVRLHLLVDCLFSALTAFAGLLIAYTKLYFIDGVVGIIISLHMIKQGIKIFRKSAGILIQMPPESIKVSEIVKTIENLPCVVDVHHIHLWQFDEDKTHFECHITVDEKLSVKEADMLRKEVEKELKKLGIDHSTIQIESSCTSRICSLKHA